MNVIFLYLHRAFGYGHVEILQDMIRVFGTSISLEGMSHADGLLPIPSNVIYPWGSHNGTRGCRRVCISFGNI